MLRITSEIIASHESLLKKYKYAIVQHLKLDTVEFIESLRKAGCCISQVFGVSYSVDQAALSQLRSSGVPVDVPDSFSQIPSRLLAIVKDCPDDLIILDVGGYACAVAERPELASKVRFIVEDTNNGLWQYNSINPRVPIIEVASIENKSVENAFIGRRIVDGITQFFQREQLMVPDAGYVVVGFGGIGRSVCSALSLKGINAAVAEIDERKARNCKRLVIKLENQLVCLLMRGWLSDVPEPHR